MQLQHILEALRGLKIFNKLAQDSLHLLELEGVDGLGQVSSQDAPHPSVHN